MSDKPAAPKHTKEAEELAQGKAKNVKVKNIRLRAIYSYDAKMAGTIFLNIFFRHTSQKSFQRLISQHTHTDELTLRADNEYIGIRLLEPEENWWYGTTVDSSRAVYFRKIT